MVIVSACPSRISLSTFYTVQHSLSWHIQLAQQLTSCNYFFCTNPPTHKALHTLHTSIHSNTTHTTYYYQVNTTPINPLPLKNLVLKVRQLNKVLLFPHSKNLAHKVRKPIVKSIKRLPSCISNRLTLPLDQDLSNHMVPQLLGLLLQNCNRFRLE